VREGAHGGILPVFGRAVKKKTDNSDSGKSAGGFLLYQYIKNNIFQRRIEPNDAACIGKRQGLMFWKARSM
jgi:hypothetical protein